MEIKSLYDCIVKAKNNDKESMLALCQKFEPLLKKYSRALSYDYEDAHSDLQETFLYTIKKIPIELEQFHQDKYILSYIKSSIHHKFIHLNKKDEEYENHVCFLSEKTPLKAILVDDSDNYSIKDIMLLTDIEHLLSEREWLLFVLKILRGYSDSDIAVMLHISRQAVNKQINKIKPKLKKYIDFKEK